MDHETYDNPLTTRYASPEMCKLWGDQRRYSTWRQLWVILAEEEAALGLPISAGQIAELKSQVEHIDFVAVAKYERKLRHDVMAHVHAYGDACPTARPIIHLGATSNFVVDNTDLMLVRDALQLVRGRLVAVILALADFAVQHRDLPTLGFTHLQPAQPTTVGKRAVLWAYDLVLDLEEIEQRLSSLRSRSTKGTTGTQASFLELFGGDHARVRALERNVTTRMGFAESYAVTGQTYPRGVDTRVLATLAGIAGSCHKAATDIRLLASRKEVEEPFEQQQIGSSAMAYKRNPMRCERICSLSRFAMSLVDSAANTHATQWMERTLDDSACRRLNLPQAFLAIDAVLLIYLNVSRGLVVYPQVIARHLAEELPFMVTENILMQAVSAGGDRQELHERIRQHSQAAAAEVKQHGRPNDLLDRLAADQAFAKVDLRSASEASGLVGRAPQQVDEFVAEVVAPIRERYAATIPTDSELQV